MRGRELAGGDWVAGIDIGGTKIAVALARAGGEVVERGTVPTGQGSDPREAVSQALSLVEEFAQRRGARLFAAGVGCAGPLDLGRGLVMSPPNLPLWREFPLRSLVESRLGVPVALENDADAAAVGEHVYGAGQGLSDLVYFTISTGIGCGIISGGELAHRPGEGGHVTVQPGGDLCGCGARGCLEALCSGTALARRARERLLAGRQSVMPEMAGGVEGVTAHTVEAAARAGDKLASELWRETVEFMAIGIGSIVTVLGPQAVILGGGVAAGAGEFLLGPLRERLSEQVRIIPMEEVRVVTAGLGADSGLYGALALAHAHRRRVSKPEQVLSHTD
jgi:glucokinase